MKYITHHRYKYKALCGRVMNIPYGTELVCDNEFISTLKGEMICVATSERCKMHFAINDDEQGLERGKLTYAIAYSRKGMTPDGGFRFSEKQRDLILRHYQRFLRPNLDMIIFNEKFFKAPIEELKEMAKELKINL